MRSIGRELGGSMLMVLDRRISPHPTKVHDYETRNRQYYTPPSLSGWLEHCRGFTKSPCGTPGWIYSAASLVEKTAVLPFFHESTSHYDQCLCLGGYSDVHIVPVRRSGVEPVCSTPRASYLNTAGFHGATLKRGKETNHRFDQLLEIGTSC